MTVETVLVIEFLDFLVELLDDFSRKKGSNLGDPKRSTAAFRGKASLIQERVLEMLV